MSTFFKEKNMSSVESDDTLKTRMWRRVGKYGAEKSLAVRAQGAGFLFALG